MQLTVQYSQVVFVWVLPEVSLYSAEMLLQSVFSFFTLWLYEYT